jgi:type II secretory pathway component PulM
MRRALLGVVLLIGCATALAWSARLALTARAEANRAEFALRRVEGQARELVTLRAKVPAPHAPGAGLAARVSATLARCGLPAAALASLSPGSVIGQRQQATLTLGAVTLPQVGSFLDAWRAAEPEWAVASIDLSPVQSGAATPGADLPLRAVIGIEAAQAEPEKAAFVNSAGGDR